jgi:hypothetical protein
MHGGRIVIAGSNHIVGERGFDREAIAVHSNQRLNGRNLYDRGLTAIAMCKMALKYCKEFCPDGKLPSGKSREDMLLYVRQKMYVHLKGSKNNKSNTKKKSKNNEDVPERILSEEDMPDKWMFNGWFAFVLYGSSEGLAQSRLTCLSDGFKDVAKVGRAEARAKEAKVETEKRRANEGGQ